MKLNNNQNKAVVSDSKYIRIIAGAGSGKTRVLTSRIAYLVNNKGVFSNKILAITFTNKAANEMKERVLKELNDDTKNPFISTIHALCVRILREDITVMNYPRNFTIIDASDQKTILKEAYKEIGLDKSTLSYPQALSFISNNKSVSLTVEQALKLAMHDDLEVKKVKVYEYYLRRQKEVFGLDFDDLLLETVKLFKMYDEVLAKWKARFHYIHVDEFQDIDNVQYQLIQLLTGKDNYLCVVGDPDQTIYTWRGANVNIIMNFENDYQPCETIVLNQNYRSTANILKGANSLIKYNKHRVEKELFTEIVSDNKIEHYSAIGEEYEGYWVSDKIQELKRKHVSYNDIAILYRSNYLSRSIEKALIENHIPYIIYGGIRFYDRAEIKDVLSYLRMIITGDDLAFLRIINTPKRGIGDKTIDKLRAMSNQMHMSMYDTLKVSNTFTGKAKKELIKFVDMIENWREIYQEMEIEKLLQKILVDSNYKKMLEDKEETERLENIKELINDIQAFTDTYKDSSLEDYLQIVSLYGDKEEVVKSECVKLMTIHSSKGLEFDNVFVTGMSEGIFPSNKSMENGNKGVEEERRLAYVAFTRAKSRLWITDSGGYSFVLQGAKVTSRFVKEIDPEVLKSLNVKKENKPIISNYGSVMRKRDDNSNLKKNKFKKGDKVIHKIFGEGIVVTVDRSIATIAFNHPHGIKKILSSHPSITKVVS